MPECFQNVPADVLDDEQCAFANMSCDELAAYQRILNFKGILITDDPDKIERHRLMVADEILSRIN